MRHILKIGLAALPLAGLLGGAPLAQAHPYGPGWGGGPGWHGGGG